MTLYHYWRSSCSWRVRMALALQKIPFQSVHVGLLDGEVDSEAHGKRNPSHYVPTLEIQTQNGKAEFLSESLAILEYLDEIAEGTDTPRLYPPRNQPLLRARVRQLCEIVNAEIQPLQNLNVLDWVERLGADRAAWTRDWIARGFEAYERLLIENSTSHLVSHSVSQWSVGNQWSAAEACLVPQVYNAHRNELDMGRFPRLQRIYEESLKLPHVVESHPDKWKP